MPTVYPGALDTLSNPTAASATTNPSHAEQHEDSNDAIEAIEGELGITPSGAAATVAARFTADEAALAAHLADSADAHDASAISILDTASDFTATDVEGALAELQTADEVDEAALAAHLADTADAHDASAVSILDSLGLYAGTTVEAALAVLPLGKLGYAEVTASQGSITTEVDLTSLTVTVTLPAGRRIRIMAGATFYSSVSGDAVGFNIKEGGTLLRKARTGLATASFSEWVNAVTSIAPSAGAHTYKLSAVREGGTGSITMYGAADEPDFILVEDLGAA